MEQLFRCALGAEAKSVDPAMNYKFDVAISGAIAFASASFKTVSGLKAEVEVINYREGGDALTDRKYAGRISYEPITFARGITSDNDAFNAFSKLGDTLGAKQQKDSLINVTISVKRRDGTVYKTYSVLNAWVSAYETADLDGGGSDVLIESFTIQHEGWTVVDVK